MNLVKPLFIGATVLFLGLLYFFFDARYQAFPGCPFNLLFHFYCPGCGSQRALSAMLHGDLLSALHDNALLVTFLPLLAYAAYRNTVLKKPARSGLFYHPLFVKLVLFAVLGFWCLRNLPFYPFNLLAPVSG
jgi:hypothetical protein